MDLAAALKVEAIIAFLGWIVRHCRSFVPGIVLTVAGAISHLLLYNPLSCRRLPSVKFNPVYLPRLLRGSLLRLRGGR